MPQGGYEPPTDPQRGRDVIVPMFLSALGITTSFFHALGSQIVLVKLQDSAEIYCPVDGSPTSVLVA